MKKLISLVLVAAMLCCVLAGCGNKEADALVGTWKADVDMTELMSEKMGADMMEYVTLSDVIFTMVLQFNSDSTFSMTLDEASVETALNGMLQSIKDGTVAMLEDQIVEYGLEMTVEEMLAASGTDLDTVFADMEAQMNIPALIEQTISEAAGEGKYDAKDGKLFLSAGLEYLPDPACYEVYTLEGNVLTLMEYVGTDSDGTFDGLYPLIFNKAA